MLERSELQKLYQYSFALTKNASDAHDLLQTALEKWVRQGKKGYAPASYVRKIIRNQFIDDCRRKQCIAFEALEDDAPAVMNDRMLEQQMIDESLVDQVMDQLNHAEREVLFLSAVMDYSATEIATEMKTSRGTILSRLFRVKKKARHIMQKLGVSEVKL